MYSRACVLSSFLLFIAHAAVGETVLQDEVPLDYSVVAMVFDQHVKVDLTTSKDSNQYIIADKQSGEYSSAILYATEIKRDTLFITDRWNPLFTLPQDKLSAHKILDSEISIELPEEKSIFLSSESGNIL